jgi:hypothetical protein
MYLLLFASVLEKQDYVILCEVIPESVREVPIGLLSQGFLSLLLQHYAAAQHIYSSSPVGCCGLVGGLYLFTSYALPLTILCIAFGSDCPCKGFSSFIPQSLSMIYLTGSS